MTGSLVSSRSPGELLSLLRQFNSFPLWWKEDEGSCRLVKTTRYKYLRGALDFVFFCRFTACGAQTRVDYRLRPGLSTILWSILLPLSLAAGLLHKPVSPMFCGVAAAANLVFVLCFFYTRRSYLKQFEDLLK